MRILHTADTHLGYTAYNKLDENGLNQREADVYKAFEGVVSLALEEKVDAVLHAGDLFDSVRPSNRAIAHALEQIGRLQAEDIPFVAISGNHSTPRLRETGSVFSIMSVLPNVKAAYRGRYEKIEVGGTTVHAIPHCPTNEAFGEELKLLAPSGGGYQVAMLHAGIVGVDVFRMGEVNENTCPLGPLIQDGFDYVALGHYHRHTEVARNVVYAGSVETLSFSEAGDAKGCVILDLSRRAWRFFPMTTRKMLDINIKWDAKKGAAAISEALEQADLEGAVLRVTLEGIPDSAQRSIDMKGMRTLAQDALHFQLRFLLADEGQKHALGSLAMRPMGAEFEDFMSSYRIEHMDRERLAALGRRYLEEAGGGG